MSSASMGSRVTALPSSVTRDSAREAEQAHCRLMPAYQVAIIDEESVSAALEHHASLEQAQQSVTRTAMTFLADRYRANCKQVAECEIRQLDGDEKARFMISVEIMSIEG